MPTCTDTPHCTETKNKDLLVASISQHVTLLGIADYRACAAFSFVRVEACLYMQLRTLVIMHGDDIFPFLGVLT